MLFSSVGGCLSRKCNLLGGCHSLDGCPSLKCDLVDAGGLYQ